MSDIERIKSNIRAMLNLAADNAAAEGEVNNALRFAKKLMQQHHLDESDLHRGDEVLLELERAEISEQSTATGATEVADWERLLALYVANLVGGLNVYSGIAPRRGPAGGVLYTPTGRMKWSGSVSFVGIAEDSALAIEIYNESRLTIASMGRLRVGGVYRKSGAVYCRGFVSALLDKIREDEPKQLKSGASTALVAKRNELIAKKQELTDRWCQTNKATSLTVPVSPFGEGEAFRMGREDGKQHNVSLRRPKKLPAPAAV